MTGGTVLSTSRPTEARVVARLGTNPRYAGSIHDRETARRFGYRAALVPGAFIYGYMSRLAVEHWGKIWLRQGTIHSHSRRPVYDGDELRLSVSALREEPEGQAADVVVHDPAGQEVATGGLGLPRRPPPAPDLAAYPVLPIPVPPPAVTAGALTAGMPLSSVNEVMDAEAHRVSLRDFGEVWPGYVNEEIVHPGLLLRLSLRDAIESFHAPTPGVYVAAFAQHFGIAHVGDRLATSGRITDAYERKGNHYFESEQLLIADGARPVALFRRRSIYAARQAAAA